MSNILRVDIVGNADNLNSSLKTASKNLSGFGKNISSIGKSLALRFTAPIALAGGAAIKMASDVEESLNKVRVSFGAASGDVENFARTTLTQFGIARGTALDMAAGFGDMATSMGISQGEASGLSTSLVGLAGDLASFKNINIEEVTTALTGVFTGETESLKRLGVVMTQVNLQNFAMSQGMQKNIKDMTQAEKVALRYQYVMSVTANAQGDFARTGGSAANQTRQFQEGLKELGAQFGEILLPVFTKIVVKMNDMLGALSRLSPETKTLSIVVAGLVASLPLLVTAFGYLTTAVGALLSPIGLVVAALAGIAYVIATNFDEVLPVLVNFYNMFVDLYNSSKTLRIAIFGLRSAFKSAFIIAKRNLDQLTNGFKTIWKIIKEFSEKGFDGSFTQIIKDGFEENEKITKKAGEDIAETFADGYADALESTLEKKTVSSVKTSLSNAAAGVKGMVAGLGQAIGLTPTSASSAGGAVTTGGTTTDESAAFDPNSVEFIDIDAEEALADDMAALDRFIEKQKLMADVAQQASAGIQGAFNSLGTSVVDSLGLGETAMGSFAGAFLQSIISSIGAALAASTAAAIQSGTQSATGFGPAAAFVLPALIAGAVAAVGAAFSKVPAFAQGGIVSAPTLAMVGDNRGAGNGNPEVIAPLNKLEGMLGGQNVNVGGQFRVEGQDLVLALQRADRNRNRIR